MSDRRAAAVAELQAKGVDLSMGHDTVEAKAARRAATKFPPRVFSPNSQCKGKRQHWSKDEAVTAARRTGNPFLSPYYCVHCHGWHIGNAARG